MTLPWWRRLFAAAEKPQSGRQREARWRRGTILQLERLEDRLAPAISISYPDFSSVTGSYKNAPFTLYGTPYYAWVDYILPTHNINVYVAQTATKPIFPLVTANYDLATNIGANAWFGFAGSCGGGNSYQDIKSWNVS